MSTTRIAPVGMVFPSSAIAKFPPASRSAMMPEPTTGLGVEVDNEIAGLDNRLRMALGAANDGVDARYQFVLVEGLRHVIVGAEAETFDLVLNSDNAREDQDRCLHFGDAQLAQYLVTRHIGQAQIKQDDVIIVEFAKINAFFAQVRGVHI